MSNEKALACAENLSEIAQKDQMTTIHIDSLIREDVGEVLAIALAA